MRFKRFFTWRSAAILFAAGAVVSVAEASRLMRDLETFVGQDEGVVRRTFGQPDEARSRGDRQTLVWRRRIVYVDTVRTQNLNRGSFASGPDWRRGDCVLEFEIDGQHMVVDVDYSGARHACTELVRNPHIYRRGAM